MDYEISRMNNVQLLSAIVKEPAAKTLVEHFGSLNHLARSSVENLIRIDGINKTKALAVKAAFALAARLTQESWEESPLLDNPERVADMLREENRMYDVEHFQVVLLNTRRRLIRIVRVAHGSLDSVIVDPRQVFFPAIAGRAASIVLAHNHPSGDPTPSEGDIKVTRDLIRAGRLLRIEVIDHIILGQRTRERDRDFVSLRELGYFAF